ncbi:SMI1/KNR4 family protein [Catellatospora sichuanensis]|uniref:SMI1/KNR4 family protein n=1 Tax=Catellatospora sichuanensis TaxID=1969805 RepID=UPI001182DBA0|nr:SMI1/KNR4 family protein [Catellatospora sichuanensis]
MTEDELLFLIRARLATSRSWRGTPVRRATPAAIAEAEQVMGLPVPPLLRRIYLEVANGGFGPWDGVIGVGPDAWTSDDVDIVDTFRGFSEAPHDYPPGLVPVYDVGCAIWWLIDFRDPSGPMWGWDTSGCCLDHAPTPQGLNLAEWLAEAYDGRESRKIVPQWVCKPLPPWAR